MVFKNTTKTSNEQNFPFSLLPFVSKKQIWDPTIPWNSMDTLKTAKQICVVIFVKTLFEITEIPIQSILELMTVSLYVKNSICICNIYLPFIYTGPPSTYQKTKIHKKFIETVGYTSGSLPTSRHCHYSYENRPHFRYTLFSN